MERGSLNSFNKYPLDSFKFLVQSYSPISQSGESVPAVPSKSSKQHRAMRVPSREELAWAAGIHDGEGSVSVHRPRRFIGVRFTVGQCSHHDGQPEMLLRLQRIFGTGRVYQLRVLGNRRPHWQFYVHRFEYVQAIVAMLWEWLTPEKREQAAVAFNTYHAERAIKGIRNYTQRHSHAVAF